MAKDVKIVKSKTAPVDKNVLWDNGESLKINRNGNWESANTTEIKEGSIPLSALSNEIYDRISNILIFNDDYSVDINNPDFEEGYHLVSDYNNEHIDAFKKYLYNLVKYGIAGIIAFQYAGDISYTHYCPFLTCSLRKEDRMKISNNNFSDIDNSIGCSWGLALDDHNGANINIALILYPKQNKLYLKYYEV